MENKKKAEIIASYLEMMFKSAKCELIYHEDYELLIAVLLSAQTTDKKVNLATEKLFTDFPTLADLNKASLEDIEKDIHQLGLSKVKAQHIKSLVSDLITRFNSKVPNDKGQLISLSGVGNKTANVVLLELFNIPEMPVDTHILRISKRFNFVEEKATPIQCEKVLRSLFKKDDLCHLHHQLIAFGRSTCKAINPQCEHCYLQIICDYYQNKQE